MEGVGEVVEVMAKASPGRGIRLGGKFKLHRREREGRRLLLVLGARGDPGWRRRRRPQSLLQCGKRQSENLVTMLMELWDGIGTLQVYMGLWDSVWDWDFVLALMNAVPSSLNDDSSRRGPLSECLTFLKRSHSLGWRRSETHYFTT